MEGSGLDWKGMEREEERRGREEETTSRVSSLSLSFREIAWSSGSSHLAQEGFCSSHWDHRGV